MDQAAMALALISQQQDGVKTGPWWEENARIHEDNPGWSIVDYFEYHHVKGQPRRHILMIRRRDGAARLISNPAYWDSWDSGWHLPGQSCFDGGPAWEAVFHHRGKEGIRPRNISFRLDCWMFSTCGTISYVGYHKGDEWCTATHAKTAWQHHGH